MTDLELLKQYGEARSQEAFAELVRRHIEWVYGAAKRLVHDREMAEDVAQGVFLALSQKAKSLQREQALSPWLLRVTRCAAISAMRAVSRRQHHEQKAAAMRRESTTRDSDAQWEEVAPLLDEQVLRLGKKDQEAILLRFYERKGLAAVGKAMGLSEEAAKKRVQRAVEKLRGVLAKKGVRGTTAGLSAVLVGNVVGETPALLVEGIMKAVGSGGGNSLAAGIAKGAMKMMTMAKVKVVAVVVGIILASGGAIVLTGQVASRPPEVGHSAAPATSMPSVEDGERVRLLADGMESNISLLGSYRASVHSAQVFQPKGRPREDIARTTVWLQKGDRYRQDITLDQLVGGKVPPPPSVSGGVTAHKSVQRAFSGEIILEYVPKDRYASIRLARKSPARLQLEREQGEPLYWGVHIMGTSLREILAGRSPGPNPEDQGLPTERTVKWIGTREYQGRPVEVVEATVKWSLKPDQQMRVRREIYIEPQRGFTVPYLTTECGLNAVALKKTEIAETECVQAANGAWIPKRTKYTEVGMGETNVSVDGFVCNPAITDDDLNVKLEDGTYVDDQVAHVQYKYGIGGEEEVLDKINDSLEEAGVATQVPLSSTATTKSALRAEGASETPSDVHSSSLQTELVWAVLGGCALGVATVFGLRVLRRRAGPPSGE